MGAGKRRAICDPGAFYPFRSLVDGPLTNLEELEGVERFLRAVVLHDELGMELEPHPYVPENEEREWTDEEIAAGKRAVIVAFGPVVEKYGLFSDDYRHEPIPDVKLSPRLLDLVSSYSNAGEKNVFYKAHVEYLQRLFGGVAQGGSVLCEGAFGRAAIEKATEFPTQLFEALDKDWQEYARKIQAGRLGFVIPPVLAIVLNRSARRDAIPAVVHDLRQEWAEPRRKVWQLVDDLKEARTLREADNIERELGEASKLFLRSKTAEGSSPLRMLWELFTAGAGGAGTATISGGNPLGGAVSGVLAQIVSIVRSKTGDPRKIFRRGAFDLARRVSHEVGKVGAMPDLLPRFLTEAEKQTLGIS